MRDGRRTRFLDGPSAVRSALRRWTPAQSLLIGVPGASEFRLPTAIDRDGIGRAAQRAAVRFYVTFAVMMCLASLPVLGVAVWFRYAGPAPYLLALGLAGSGALFAMDARAHKRSLERLHHRALFFYWLRRCRRVEIGASVYMGLLMLMSGLQWWVMQPGGTLAAAFDAYGLLHPRFQEGEVWRLLTGPYLHDSVVHFALNGILLVFLGALAWAYRGGLSLLVFASACSLSLAAQMLFGSELYDHAAGISGGVYALVGLILGGTLHRPWQLPDGLTAHLLVLMLLALLVMELISTPAATVAHVTGLGFGLVVGIALAEARAW